MMPGATRVRIGVARHDGMWVGLIELTAFHTMGRETVSMYQTTGEYVDIDDAIEAAYDAVDGAVEATSETKPVWANKNR